MPAVYVYEPIAQSAIDLLKEKGYEVFRAYAPEDAPIPFERIEALILRIKPFTAQDMDRLPQLKIITDHGVGTDSIDLNAAKARGILVTNTPGANSLSVAEHTMALLLALSKQLPFVHATYKQRDFQSKYRYTYSEIAGKTLGVIGLGDIGARVALMAQNGFSMRVLAYDPCPKNPVEGVEMVSDLNELYAQSDFITLHCPSNKHTFHLIDAQALARMKPSACLINCARGAIVDETALVDALVSGQIAGAALDATEPEPAPDDSPLYTLPNVILTPHIAASTQQALRRMAHTCAECIDAFFTGREVKNRVV